LKQQEFEDLVTAAGLNLLSRWAPRFIVSLYVPIKIKLENGTVLTSTRRQTAVITFGSRQGLEDATTEEAQAAIDDAKGRLYKAAKTKQGDIAHKDKGEVKVRVEQEVVAPVGINYPAH
jgi:transcription elongation GreA/GreB family factor